MEGRRRCRPEVGFSMLKTDNHFMPLKKPVVRLVISQLSRRLWEREGWGEQNCNEGTRMQKETVTQGLRQ
jgi:hypothetical protein